MRMQPEETAWPIVFGTVTKRHPFIHATSNPALGAAWKIRRRAMLDHEIPSLNGVTNARALARIYGAVAANTGELPISKPVIDFITGDAGNDKITAGKGDDRVDGGAGEPEVDDLVVLELHVDVAEAERVARALLCDAGLEMRLQPDWRLPPQ